MWCTGKICKYPGRRVVVDIGSGGGIDVFLSANKVKESGKVIGIDMTDEMLEKAPNHAKEMDILR
jgi:arsenite methyltransferase